MENTEKSSGYILLLEAKCTFLEQTNRDFPGGPVVKILPSNAMGMHSIPGLEAKISHISRPENQNIKQKL